MESEWTMGREQLARMDVDTGWVYHRHWRAIQREEPIAWPVYAVAWFALLGESWKVMDRVRLEDAWPAALEPAMLDQTRQILTKQGLLDRAGKIPRASWDEWIGPTLRRMEAGVKGANGRWGTPAMPSHNGGNANSQPASQPYQPARKERGRKREGTMTRAADVALAMGFGDTYPDGTPRRKAAD